MFRSSQQKKLAFVLVPGFSTVTLGCAIEAFRLVNERSRLPPFAYWTLGIDARTVRSNDDLTITADDVIGTASDWDIVFVVSSINSVEFESPRLSAWLRKLARSGSRIAAVGSAVVPVAKAGLLDGYRCAAHWRLFDQLAERFPRVHVVRDLYCIDRDRLTSAGGFSAVDLGLTIAVQATNDPDLILEVAEFSMLSRFRPPTESQRMAVQWRFGITDERVARAIELMESHLEQPLPIRDLARACNLSERQLERLFLKRIGKSPHQVYLEIRLTRGQQMLTETRASVFSIALMCGFADGAHFSRQYKALFGESPAAFRAAYARHHALLSEA